MRIDKINFNRFRCSKCGVIVTDYIHYPLCVQCRKSLKKQVNRERERNGTEDRKKQKNHIKKLKRSLEYYNNNKELCEYIYKTRNEEKITFREISERVTSLGYETKTGVKWTAHMIFFLYKVKEKADKTILEIEKLEKDRENS